MRTPSLLQAVLWCRNCSTLETIYWMYVYTPMSNTQPQSLDDSNHPRMSWFATKRKVLL